MLIQVAFRCIGPPTTRMITYKFGPHFSMSPLVQLQGVAATSMVRTFVTPEVWSSHVLPLDVSSQHLGRAETFITDGAGLISMPDPS